MAALYDITNWNKQAWVSTGGTRSKKYVQSPKGKFYYFKKSLKKPGYEYTYEFWNEVIATEVGNMLGFNMLRYDIAIDGEEMGCISESMISGDGEELVEGGKYLQAYENNFTPDIKNTRAMYSFQLIEDALDFFKLDEYITQIVEVAVFDAIISNGDRHQENWAFINELGIITTGLNELEKVVRIDHLPKGLKWFLKVYNFLFNIFDLEKREMKPEAKAARLYLSKIKGFAPIYDSGSSLGRELSEEKVNTLFNDESQFNAYINRGLSEIHWDNEKVNHFDFISKLLETSYGAALILTIERVLSGFDESKLKGIVTNIDAEVPQEFEKFKLSKSRKRLIIKLITSRLKRLKALYDERD